MTTTLPAVPDTLPAPVDISPATERLIRDSTSANTRRAYAGALARLDAYLDGQPLDDAALAEYLGALDADGKAPASAAMVVAAVRFRAKLHGQPDPAGPIADRALRGFHREGRAERGRGQAPALDLATIGEIAGQCSPRDRAIILVTFQACLRRSETAALEWRDVEPAGTPGALRITVRASKTNQEGAPDVRLVKGSAERALLAIKPDDARPGDSIFGLSGQSIGRRITTAARKAGYRATAHSLRVTYASELTRLGASTTEVMRAGAWRTARMVAHYAAGVDAEGNATAKYL